MDAPAVALGRAPAWIFLACSASLATLFAGAALWQDRGQAAKGPQAARPQFGLKGLAEAAPKADERSAVAAAPDAAAKQTAAASPVEHPGQEPAPIERPSPPVAKRAAEVAHAPAPIPPSPPASAAGPIRPVAPDPKLQSAEPVQGASQYGAVVSGKFAFAGLSIPLPPGEWRVAADIPFAQGRDVALVRDSGKAIAAVAILSANWGGNGLGYPKHAYCSRRMLRGAYEKTEDFGDQACWSGAVVQAKTLVELQPKTALGKALVGELGARLKGIRSDMLVDSALTLSNLNRRILCLYFFDPEADGIEPKPVERLEDSEWAQKNITQYPEKVKYLRERLQWASQAYQELKQAFAAWN